MKDYQILCGQGEVMEEAIKKLEYWVREALIDGWKFQGGVSIATEVIGYTVHYTACQAMIKNE